jgi:cell division protein FtsX
MDFLTVLAIAIFSFVMLIVLTAYNIKLAASLLSKRRHMVEMSKKKSEDDENDVVDNPSDK